MTRSARQPPRGLHPAAWWVWALGLATVASRSRNPLLLLLLLAVTGYVVTARRSDAPWARAFVVFLKLGVVVVAIRTLAQILLAPAQPGTVLFSLPSLALPEWASGVSLGGDITAPSVAFALTEGLRLAMVLVCIGAANALANPKRLLRSLPAALYEVGVALVIALAFAPSLVTSGQRIREARRLRGRPDRGLRSIISVVMPVLEDALERAVRMAAAMDSRGYGRRADLNRGLRFITAALTLGGLIGVAVGLYGLLDASAPDLLGIPSLLMGLVAATGGLALAGRRTVRSRYRPDPWRFPETLTAGTGVLAAVGVLITASVDPAGLAPTLLSFHDLSLPLAATIGLLLAVLPAWLTPPPTQTLPAPAHASPSPTDLQHTSAPGSWEPTQVVPSPSPHRRAQVPRR